MSKIIRMALTIFFVCLVVGLLLASSNTAQAPAMPKLKTPDTPVINASTPYQDFLLDSIEKQQVIKYERIIANDKKIEKRNKKTVRVMWYINQLFHRAKSPIIIRDTIRIPVKVDSLINVDYINFLYLN